MLYHFSKVYGCEATAPDAETLATQQDMDEWAHAWYVWMVLALWTTCIVEQDGGTSTRDMLCVYYRLAGTCTRLAQ